MLNLREIALLIAEMQDWRGASVQKVQQSAVDHVALGLRRPGESAWLHLRMQRGNLRFYLHPRKATALPRAPAFTMALRKHLVGQRLTDIHQPEGERIVHFGFAREDRRTTLILELLPPGGNIILLHAGDRILARLFNDQRSGTVGRPYQPPPPPPSQEGAGQEQGGKPVREWSGDSFHAFLALADRAGEAPSPDDVEERDDREARKAEGWRESKRVALLKRLDADWAKAGDPAVWRRYGEVLAANPQVETRDRTEVAVTTPEGEEMVIPVQRRLTLSENVEAYFKKAKKAGTARKHIAQRRELLESGQWEPGRARPATGPSARSAQNQKNPTPSTREGGGKEGGGNLPVGHVFRFPGGSIIAVGRSAKENDRLTFGWARGQDYWTHVRGVQGAHVLARHAMGDDLEQLLEAAARLALHYSAHQGEKAGDLQQIQRKYVQSVRGVPGRVRVTRDENRRVTLSEADLAALDALRVKR